MIYSLIGIIRGFLKNKLYSFLLIIGLALGMASFLFIQLYIDYEKSFDLFHEHGKRIYRVQQNRYNQGELRMQTVAGNAGAAQALVKNFAEVERSVQMARLPSIVQYDDISFKEDQLAFSSRDFFNIFSFKLIDGIDSLVLQEPFTAVLSESTAKRYFQSENPVGKILKFRGRYELLITGIYEDMPNNCHFNFDLLVSFGTYFKFKSPIVRSVEEEPWRWDGFYTYALLRNGADAKALQEKLPAMVQAETGRWLDDTNQALELSLQPLGDIHLRSAFSDEIALNGNNKNIGYLQLIALFIIAIAWINYISLTTAKSIERGKEVGVRKVLGSHKFQLIGQFLLESFVLNLIALFITVILFYILLPYFNQVIDRELDVFYIWNTKLFLILGSVLIIGTLASGFYPAWILSSFNPTLILKGKFQASSSGKSLRKFFVILPFSISIILVSCLFIIYSQISFLRNQKLGFSLEQKLAIRDSEIYDSLNRSRAAIFKSELIRLPGIEKTSYISHVPGDPLIAYANSVRRLSSNETEVNQYKYITVDENFIEVFDLTLLAGRNFVKSDEAEITVLVNELATRLLGFKDSEEAVNGKIIFRDDTVQIVGVVNNLYHESPKNPLQPVVYPYDPKGGTFYIIPIETMNASAAIENIRGLFSTTFPSQPFSFFFLDDRYNNQYKGDLQFGKIITIFSFLLLLITALGLFGLSTYSSKVRRKEIGIRKVLGASETRVVMLFCKEYAWLLIIACCIGIPISWYVMHQWLETFSIKIEITLTHFILPALVIVLITLLTIGFQTIKAALINPTDALKHE